MLVIKQLTSMVSLLLCKAMATVNSTVKKDSDKKTD